MKNDLRHARRFGPTFRFVLRGLGLLGLLVAVVGATMVATETPTVLQVKNWAEVSAPLEENLKAMHGLPAQVGTILLLAGAGAFVLYVMVELLSLMVLVTGRKSAAGLGNTVQVILAVVLLLVVNALSFQWYWRFDATRDHRFTLDAESLNALKSLDPNTPTTIVVLQMDKTSALEPEQPDALATAAQQKITEKVLDLIDELRQNRELGSRFQVHVLHTKDEAFPEKLNRIAAPSTEGFSTLRSAIEHAHENSIFFAANNRVRRMPFSQFYLLDQVASRDDRNGANLVLHPQGKDRFVRALVSLETKKPKVALAVIHPLLASRKQANDYTALGLRNTLEDSGFEVTDVILKKWSGPSTRGEPPAAAYSYDETEFTKAEGTYNLYSLLTMEREQLLALLKRERERIEKAPLAVVDRDFRRALGRPIREEQDRAAVLSEVIDFNVTVRSNELAQYRKQRDEVKPLYDKLLADDRLLESRRNTNIKQKFAQAVADCDLLILPRFTIMDVVGGAAIPASLYKLSTEQAEVAKDFLTAGKPVLFAFGPTNAETRRSTPEPATDAVDQMLARLGVELGTQTILSDAEVQQMAERRGDDEQIQGEPTFAPLTVPNRAETEKDGNGIAAAYQQLLRSLGGKIELRKGGARPIDLTKALRTKANIVLETGPDTWNETKPFADSNSVPTFDPAKPNDPKKGTREEERRGPFPVGVAFETRVPAEWLNPNAVEPQARAVLGGVSPLAIGLPLSVLEAAHVPEPTSVAPTVRIAVYGHGGLFVGKKLEPAQDALLLTTVNWLLRRDDALPNTQAETTPWSYPRVPLAEKTKAYWSLAMFPGLPLLAAVFGLFSWMVRRAR